MGIQAKVIALLVGMLSLVLAFGVGHHYGKKAERDAEASVKLAVVNGALDAGRISAKTEADKALAFAKRQADARAAASEAQHQLEMEIARDEAARQCRVSDPVFKRLLESVDRANSDDPSPSAK